MAEHRRTVNAAGNDRPGITIIGRVRQMLGRHSKSEESMTNPYPSASTDLFGDIALITTWLNAHYAYMNPEQDDASRIMRIGQQYGIAMSAYTGYIGNPRDGRTHSLQQLLSELAEIAVTALCAIHRFTEDERATRSVVLGRIAYVTAQTSNGFTGEPERPHSERPPADPDTIPLYPYPHNAGTCACGARHTQADMLALNTFP